MPELSSRVKQLPLHGMAAYELLKTATEVFLLLNCGVAIRPKDALETRSSTTMRSLRVPG